MDKEEDLKENDNEVQHLPNDRRLEVVEGQPNGSENDDQQQNSSDGDSARSSAVDAVYMNGMLVSKILSFLSSVKCRAALERCSQRMRRLSLSSAYQTEDVDNTALDISFRMVAACATLSIAGNSFHAPALTSERRIMCPWVGAQNEQDDAFIKTFEGVVKRFSKQICKILVGGISDDERFFGFIPNHQLVITSDVSTEMEKLKNVDSIAFREVCISAPVLDFWSSGTSKLIQRLRRICFHGVWFDRVDDCTLFVDMLPCSLKHLHVSECSSKTISLLMSRLSRVGAHLDSLTIAIDYRTFHDVNSATLLLQDASRVANEIRLYIMVTDYFIQPAHRILMGILPELTTFDAVTSIEFDVGTLRKFRVGPHTRFFKGLRHLSRLRRLVLTGQVDMNNTTVLWNILVEALSQLTQLKELSLFNVAKSVSKRTLCRLFATLPTGLAKLNLQGASNFNNRHLALIAKQCPKLEMLRLSEAGSWTSAGLVENLAMFPKLRGLFLNSEVVDCSLIGCLANPSQTPRMEAVVMLATTCYCEQRPCCLQQLDDELRNSQREMFARFRRRFPWSLSGESDTFRPPLHVWNVRNTYLELDRLKNCTCCPGCEKDFSLISNEDLDFD